jgi:hypothetical protein
MGSARLVNSLSTRTPWHAIVWRAQIWENKNVVCILLNFLYIHSTCLLINICTFYQDQTVILPRMSCWGSHVPIFTFAGCPGKRADSHFHKIFCGNSEKASIKTRLVSSGIWSLRILLPKLKYITPSLASSRKFWISWKYSTLQNFYSVSEPAICSFLWQR